jgi:hypothetical protein
MAARHLGSRHECGDALLWTVFPGVRLRSQNARVFGRWRTILNRCKLPLFFRTNSAHAALSTVLAVWSHVQRLSCSLAGVISLPTQQPRRVQSKAKAARSLKSCHVDFSLCYAEPV